MGCGKATVKSPDSSSVSGQVRDATGNAVRDAQNAGASKKEVIQARDSAKAGVYEKVIAGANAGNAGAAKQLAEINNSADHQLNLKNAGLQNQFVSAAENYLGGINAQEIRSTVLNGSAHAIPGAGAKQQNPKTIQAAVVQYAESTKTGSDLIKRIKENETASKIIDELTDDTKTVYTLQGTKITKEKVPKTEGAKSGFKSFNEAAAAGYYGEETEYTQKIDRNSNVISDILDGTASTLMDPSRLKTTHENPNILAKYINKADDFVEKTPLKYTPFSRPIENTQINVYDWIAKSKNPAVRFVRGGTLDNAAGLITLGSEAVKTGSAVFLPKSGDPDLYKDVAYQPRDGINIMAASVGRMAGGTGAALKDDPVAFAGSLIIPFPIKLSAKGIKAKGTGVFTTFGRTSNPIKNMQIDKVSKLEGDVFREKMVYPDNYPTFDAAGKTIETPLKMFKETPKLYPGSEALAGDNVMIHAHPNSWGDVHYGRIGKHGDPGTFGGPNLSTKFLRMPEIKIGGIGFSNPLGELATTVQNTKKVLTGKRDLYSPSIDFISHKGFERLPEEVRWSRKASREWMIKEADPSKAYLTHKLESNIDAGKHAVEPEAAITPGAEFALIEKTQKTTVKQPITIFGKETIPGTNIKLQMSVDVPVNLYEATGEMKTNKRKRATGIVETDKGILLVEEKSGALNLPGGGVDGKFESGSKAVLRELSEETGLKGKKTKKAFDYTDETKKRSNQGGLYFNEHLVYDVILDSDSKPNIKNNKEIVNIEYWKPGTELPANLNSASRDILMKRYPGTKSSIPALAKTVEKTNPPKHKNQKKQNTKDISDFNNYAERFGSSNPIPIVDLSYLPKPGKSKKYTPAKATEKKSTSTPISYNGLIKEYKNPRAPTYSQTKTQPKTKNPIPILTQPKRPIKRIPDIDLLGQSKKKTQKKSDSVLKEFRINKIGDLKI